MIKSFLTNRLNRRSLIAIFAALAVIGSGTVVYATHSWGSYHWAQTSNPFTLKLGDNVSSIWDGYLSEASSDWSVSSSTLLGTSIVAGGTNNTKGKLTPKNCVPTSGRVEVCNAKYGSTGWLGVAQIWANGSHIVQGTAKMNDTYFNTQKYNTPAWRRLVMCQEVAHTFGLSHQDENFSNINLGTCMDYTDDPDGTIKGQLSNEHPNIHDFDQLALIYAHLDTSATLGAEAPSAQGKSGHAPADVSEPGEWGRVLRRDGNGRPSHYERDLGNGQKVFTFVFWAD
ncbi:MAG: hypothetical protein HY617_03335 [Candidatus Sungbacteria bacterium]|nr:hypothetical protein [Candidatus Sungbacteria bacterium]